MKLRVFLIVLVLILSTLVLAETPVENQTSTPIIGAANILPSPAEMAKDPILSDWKPVKDSQIFTSDELWKQIDGADALYLNYGCKSLTVAYYKNEKKEADISIEIYQMTNNDSAYGVYAVQKPSGITTGNKDIEYLPIGTQCYLEAHILNFCQGLYYVKLQQSSSERVPPPPPIQKHEDKNTTPKSSYNTDAIQALAKLISAKIPGENKLSEIFNLFPKNGLVENSYGYQKKNLLDISEFQNCYYASYKHECPSGSTFQLTLYLIRKENQEAAKKALNSYAEFIKNRSQEKLKEAKIQGYEGFWTEDPYQGPILAVTYTKSNQDSAFVILLIGCEQQCWIEKILTDLSDSIANNEKY